MDDFNPDYDISIDSEEEEVPYFGDYVPEVERTEDDSNWLVNTIYDLCVKAGELERFQSIENELRERKFLSPIFIPSIEKKSPTMTSPFNQIYNTICEVGKGGFGRVIKVQNLIDNQFYALKVVQLSKKEITNAVVEIQCLAALNSRRIVRYFSSWVEEDSIDSPQLSLFIQMEYIKGITISDYLDAHRDVSDDILKNLLYQIVLALSEIHQAGIVHRDFTPSNIMIRHDGSIVVIDFGISAMSHSSRMQKAGGFIQQPRVGSLNIRPVQQLLEKPVIGDRTQSTGTPLYSSPQQLSGKKTKPCDDIYSLGIIMFEFFSRFKTYMEKAASIRCLRMRGEVPQSFSDKYPDLADLIMKCVSSERPSATDILSSSFFSGCSEEISLS